MPTPDIYLVRTPDWGMKDFKKIGAIQHPLNLVYLATWLKKENHTAEIIDLEIEPFSFLEARLKTRPPRLVGVTVTTPNMGDTKKICSLCNSFNIQTVLGGPHPTALPVETLHDTACSYVVIGEGEKPLSNLLHAIKTNSPVDAIEGIALMRHGDAIVNRCPNLIDVNELPIPDRKMLTLEKYQGETTPGIQENAAIMFTSRGCAYACTFCASRVINQQRVRFRSIERIFQEVDEIIALGFNHLTIEDDSFTVNPKRVIEFCSYLLKKYPDISWDCDSRVDVIDEKLIAAMRASHCKKISFGVESGSPRILQSINKKIDIDQAKKAIRLAKEHGILTQSNFIIGFPDETLEDIKATEKLIAEINPDLLLLSIAVPFPGTEIYQNMKENRLIENIDWEKFVFFGSEVPWRTLHFSGKELIEIRKRISRNFYFRPSYLLKRLQTVRSLRDFRYLVKGGLVACNSFFK